MRQIDTNSIKILFYEYKRRKLIKKKIIVCVSSVLLFCLIVGLAYVYSNRNEIFPHDNSCAAMNNVGVKADLGDNDYLYKNVVANTYSDSTEDIIVGNSADKSKVDVLTTTEVEIYDNVYEVPDTELKPVEEVKGKNWYNKELFSKLKNVPVDINYFSDAVFIGDSRTEGLLLYSGLPNMNAYTYKGLSIDKLKDEKCIEIPGVDGKFTCYEAISQKKYKYYYCMFGVNELGWIYSDAFVDEFEKLIDYIFDVNSDAIIYVESILPVTEEKSTEDNIYNQEKIEEYNRELKKLCKSKKNVIYLDVAASVKNDDGYLPGEASVDGVHCNSDYCKRIIQYIRYNIFEKTN